MPLGQRNFISRYFQHVLLRFLLVDPKLRCEWNMRAPPQLSWTSHFTTCARHVSFAYVTTPLGQRNFISRFCFVPCWCIRSYGGGNPGGVCWGLQAKLFEVTWNIYDLIIEWPCGWAGTGDVGRPVFRSARFTDSMQECRHQPETGSKAFEERVATGVFPSFTRQRAFAGLAAQDGQCLEMRSILGRSSEGIAEWHRSFGWTLRSELRAARIRLLQRCQCDCAWRGAGSITPDIMQDSVNDARSETTAAVTLNGVDRDRRGRGSWTTWLVLQWMGSLRYGCAQSCFATKGPGSPTSVSCAVTPRSSHTREAVLQPATIMFSPLRLRAVMLFVCQTAIATAAMWMFCSSLRLWHCLAGFQTSLLSPLRLRAVQPTCNQRQWPHATSACVMHSSQSSCGCIGFTLSVLVPFAISTWPNI